MKVRFSPRLVPSIATLVLVPIMLGLGYWQLDRAQQKIELQDEYDKRMQGPTIAIGGEPQLPEDLRYYKVVAKGRYDGDRQFLIDNRVHHGRVGYHVITPLKIEGSNTRVLVNRGWVALGQDREHPPKIETPDGLQEITGVAIVPSERFFSLGPQDPIGGSWVTLWQYMDMQRFRASVAYPVQPVVILLNPRSPAGGFVREWSRLDAGIATHKAYAFQWFTLAFALLAIYIVVNTRYISK
jgi:surfeit locus 1 family protein